MTMIDTHLYKLCDEAGISRFCMHVLGYASYRKRYVAEGGAKTTVTRRYQNNDG